MIKWHELPSKQGKFFNGEMAGTLEDALPEALTAILAKLAEYTWATRGDVTVHLEAGVDTGRLIAAIETAETTNRDGCAVRLQGLQDFWYDTDEGVADEDTFASEIQNMRRKIGSAFLALLEREGRTTLRDASTLRFVMAGGEPGEVLDEHMIF